MERFTEDLAGLSILVESPKEANFCLRVNFSVHSPPLLGPHYDVRTISCRAAYLKSALIAALYELRSARDSSTTTNLPRSGGKVYTYSLFAAFFLGNFLVQNITIQTSRNQFKMFCPVILRFRLGL